MNNFSRRWRKKVNFIDIYPFFNVHIAKKQCLPHMKKASTWELTGSNRRPSACKADALNQLS